MKKWLRVQQILQARKKNLPGLINQRLSEAESEVSAVHTSSGTSVNEATEATVSETSFGEGAESGALVGSSVGEQAEPEKSVSEVGDRVMLDGDVSEAVVGNGAVMMGDVGACSSRVECRAKTSS